METTELFRVALSFSLMLLLVATGRQINAYGMHRYRFKPVTLPLALLALSVWIFPVLGVSLLAAAPVPGLMLMLSAIPAILWLFHDIRLRSDVAFAFAATVYLIAANVLIVAVLPLMRERCCDHRRLFSKRVNRLYPDNADNFGEKK